MDPAARKKLRDAAAEHRAWPIACCAARAILRKCARNGRITREVAQEALRMIGVDEHGLDEVDRNLMIALIDKYAGGPVGLGTLAAALSEEEDAIEEMYEPYLMQIGMLDRTPRGRVATPRAYEYFGRDNCRSASHDCSSWQPDYRKRFQP